MESTEPRTDNLLQENKSISGLDADGLPNSVVPSIEIPIGERVFVHSYAWNQLADAYRQFRYKFKDRLYDFNRCIGYVLNWKDEHTARVRFYTREADGTTTTTDFLVPRPLLEQAPLNLRFEPEDLVVIVDLAAYSQKVMIVCDSEPPKLMLESMTYGSRTEMNEEECLLIPVYNSQKPWLLEKVGGHADRSALIMDRLLFDTSNRKLSPDVAMHVLKWTAESKDDRLLREASWADPDFINSKIGDSIALVEAIRMKSPYLVALLLACGANARVRDQRGNSLLHIAVELNAAALWRVLEFELRDSLNSLNQNGESPLHFACRLKQQDFIVLLLANSRVDLNCRNGDGQTGLHVLIGMPEFDPVRDQCICLFLTSAVRRHALVAINKTRLTPLMAAIEWKKDEALSLMLRKLPPGDLMIGSPEMQITLIQALARAGNFAAFKQAAEKCNGQYLETQTHRSPLHFAVESWTGVKTEDYDRCRIIEFLCCTGNHVVLNKRDAFDNTPIHLLAKVVNQLDTQSPFDVTCFPAIIAAKMSNLADMLKASNKNYSLAVLCFFSACGGDFQLKNKNEHSPLNLIERVEVRVLLSDCAKCGFNEWVEPEVSKPRVLQFTPDGRLVSDVINEMKAQISALEDHVFCGICMEAKARIAFGCGHTACEECARQLRNKKESLCHVCRKRIENTVTIY